MNIGIKDSTKTVDLLNKLLANELVLYQKTRNFHWNVEGPHFNDLHKLFEEQYDELAEHGDEIAERVRTLGHRPLSTMTEALEAASLQEKPCDFPKAEAMVEQLLADHEQIIREIRKMIDQVEDVGSEDFLTGLLQAHEKTAWMLRSVNA